MSGCNESSARLSTPISFNCSELIGTAMQQWDGYVNSIHDYGSHYEIQIESRSGFSFIVGKCMSGNFISVPSFNVGCHLSHFSDYFWNNENLARMISPVDAATIAEALRLLSKKNYL